MEMIPAILQRRGLSNLATSVSTWEALPGLGGDGRGCVAGEQSQGPGSPNGQACGLASPGL